MFFMNGDEKFSMKFRTFLLFFVFLKIFAEENSQLKSNTDELTAFGPGEFERGDGNSPINEGDDFASALLKFLQERGKNEKSEIISFGNEKSTPNSENNQADPSEYCSDESLPDSICIRLNDAHAQCNCSGIEWILVCVKNVWAPSLSKICPEEFFEKSSNSLKNSKNCLPLQIPDANLRRLGSIEADPLSIPIGTTFEAICADPNRNFGDFEGAEKIVFMCSSDGRWAPDPNLIKCGPSGTENSANSDPDMCPMVTVAPDIRYVYSSGSGLPVVGTEVQLSCRQADYRVSPVAVLKCEPGGKWSDSRVPTCVPIGCEKPDVLRPDLIRRTIYPTAPTCDPFGQSAPCPESHGRVLPDVTVYFTCDPASKFQLIGETELTCMRNNRWSGQIPNCERRKYCRSPTAAAPGAAPKSPALFYSSFFGTEKDFYEMGETLTFGCVAGFALVGKAQVECGPEGRWTHDFPVCLDLSSSIDGSNNNNNETVDNSSKRFIAMVAVGGLVGLLLLVLLIFLVQRHWWMRKLRGNRRRRLRNEPSHPQLLAAGPLARVSGEWTPDRLALIAYAAEAGRLPTYDEAMGTSADLLPPPENRAPPPFDALSTISAYASRAVRRLPSMSSLRSRDPNLPPLRPLHDSSHENFVGSSAETGINLNFSETNSTTVTLETLSSGRNDQSCSSASSSRPAVGSMMGSDDSHLVGDDSEGIPLIEEQSEDSKFD